MNTVCTGKQPDDYKINDDPPIGKSSPAPKPKGLKYDSGKLRYSLIPPIALTAIASVLTFGAKKYAPNNWQLVNNAEERYIDALYRHLEAHRSGERIDPESLMPHLWHVITNVAFLIFFDQQNNKE